MTLSNQITLGRILLIPVFVAFALYYARSVQAGAPSEWLRYAAIATFAAAALSDAVDGWLARRRGQQTSLGRILDPLADKLLLVAAVMILIFSDWPARLPLWFVVVVLTREVLAIAGAFVVDHIAGRVRIQPHLTGKLATFFQVITVAAAMLQLDVAVIWAAAAAIAFTLISGALYLTDAARQVRASGSG